MKSKRIACAALALILICSIALSACGTRSEAQDIVVTYVTSPLNVPSIVEKNHSIFAETMKDAGVKICIGSMWGSACAGHDDDRAVKNADAAWGWILEQGATQIMTDRPYELLNYLQERDLHR